MSADRVDSPVSRRRLLGGTAALAGALTEQVFSRVEARSRAGEPRRFAPAGFVPLSAPGKIVKVSKSDVLMPKWLFPKEDAARAMLERAMTELTGETDLAKRSRASSTKTTRSPSR